MDKRWVFQELVKKRPDGSLDVIGYVAYALYKAKKDELATSLRQAGNPEDVIVRRLNEFHDNVLNTNECDDLRVRAENIIDESLRTSLDDMERTLNTLYDREETSLKKEYESKQKELQKERELFEKEKRTLNTKVRKEETAKLANAAKNIVPKGRLLRSVLWLWNGFAGLFATILTGVFVFGMLVYFGDADTKQEALGNLLQWLAKTLTSNPLPDSN